MKKSVFLLSGLLAFSTAFATEYKYSTQEVYTQMCSQCHGATAQGNPEKKGPALNDLSKTELEMELYKLEADKYHLGESAHEIMEHNLKKIQEKGMTYNIPTMAEYIFKSFNPKAKK